MEISPNLFCPLEVAGIETPARKSAKVENRVPSLRQEFNPWETGRGIADIESKMVKEKVCQTATGRPNLTN